MRGSRIYLYVSVLCTALYLSGCVPEPPKPPPKPVSTGPKQSYWKGDGVNGKPGITINLTEQRAYFYKDDKLVGESTISSGKKGFETPPGQYKVIQKDKDHHSNLYGEYVDETTGETVQKNVDVTKDPAPEGTFFYGAKMTYFLRFTGGYGMHAGYVPRYRASHGCVRMPIGMAEHFFNAAEVGTPVTVVEDPEPGQPAQDKKTPAPAAKAPTAPSKH